MVITAGTTTTRAGLKRYVITRLDDTIEQHAFKIPLSSTIHRLPASVSHTRYTKRKEVKKCSAVKARSIGCVTKSTERRKNQKTLCPTPPDETKNP
jgi:hypothetical protein